jgi:hypothetical protein
MTPKMVPPTFSKHIRGKCGIVEETFSVKDKILSIKENLWVKSWRETKNHERKTLVKNPVGVSLVE